MCWQCDHPESTLDDYLDHLRGIIADHRWAVQCVEDDKRPLAYTVGLHKRGLPELVVTGLPPLVAHRLLTKTAHLMVDHGEPVEAATVIDDDAELLLEVVDVDHPDVHLLMAVNLYGPRFRALQLVWADNRGRFPWEPRWAHGRRHQPVLGRRVEAA